MDICSENAVQGNLFDKVDREKHKNLMDVLDKVNNRYGRNTLKFAVMGDGQSWKIKQRLFIIGTRNDGSVKAVSDFAFKVILLIFSASSFDLIQCGINPHLATCRLASGVTIAQSGFTKAVILYCSSMIS